jgi:hypothetical protein
VHFCLSALSIKTVPKELNYFNYAFFSDTGSIAADTGVTTYCFNSSGLYVFKETGAGGGAGIITVLCNITQAIYALVEAYFEAILRLCPSTQ